MEAIVQDVVKVYGPLGFGWLGFAWLLWRNSKEAPLIRHTLDKNTEALISFRILLEERLPRGGRNQ